MKSDLRTITISTLLATLLLSGCGDANRSASSRASKTQGSVSIDNSGTTTDSDSTSDDDSISTGIDPYKIRVGTVGYNSVSVKVITRRVLKVKFTPGVQDETIEGTGVSRQYAGLGVYLTVGSNTQATPLLSNGVIASRPAESSQVFDFSSSFTGNCTATSCEPVEVTITISKQNYDYWCVNWGVYCPWTRVDDKVPWHGTLTVQTDDTDAI